jgi:hypothetical protein
MKISDSGFRSRFKTAIGLERTATPFEPRQVRIASFTAAKVLAKPDLGGAVIDTIASGSEVTAHEQRGVFTRITVPNGSSGWIQTSDIQKA